MITSLIWLAFASLASAALNVDLNSPDSIRAAAKIVATNLISYYHGGEPGQTPGILPGPPPGGKYYWWEGGAMWGAMVDYWHYTGDTTWNDLTESSLVFQAGPPGYSYMPDNWTISLGNDDQGFWGMSAMLAAETNFQNPPSDQPQWLALAQAVFNTQAAPNRHDDLCGGGLRWQIPITNTGYDYKNSIANGIFFNLGARLARYTGNATYGDIATGTYDWVKAVNYIDDSYNIFDGGHVQTNCTDIDKAQFSYIAAVFLQGAGFMYNYTDGSDIWRARVEGLVNQTINFFFPSNETTNSRVAIEPSCEFYDGHPTTCNTDMMSFKSYLIRWMANTAQVAPFLSDRIMAVLKSSAEAAVESCTEDGTCGFGWHYGGYDGSTGVGQQMNALAALTSLLATLEPDAVEGPLTNQTGGTSAGNANAGSDPDMLKPKSPPTRADAIKAGCVTAGIALFLVLTLAFMNTRLLEGGRKFREPVTSRDRFAAARWG